MRQIEFYATRTGRGWKAMGFPSLREKGMKPAREEPHVPRYRPVRVFI